jgi:hypothetical protein
MTQVFVRCAQMASIQVALLAQIVPLNAQSAQEVAETLAQDARQVEISHQQLSVIHAQQAQVV